MRSLSKCIARAIATACRSPPDSERIGVEAGIDLPIPTSAQKVAGDLAPSRCVHAVEEARALERLAAEEQIARDRELRDQRRILVDRLDAERDRVGRAADVDLLPRTMMSPLVARTAPDEHLDQRRLARAVVAEQPDDLLARRR